MVTRLNRLTMRRTGGADHPASSGRSTRSKRSKSLSFRLCAQGCRTKHVPQPHPNRVGELKHGSHPPGLRDHKIGAAAAARLVVTQPHLDRGRPAQRVGEDYRVLQGLAGALAEIGGRGVNGVAEQGHGTRTPDAPRWAIDDIVSQDGLLFGRLDDQPERDTPVSYVLQRLPPVAEGAGM